MNDITKIKVDGEPESSYQLYPRNEEFAKRAGGGNGGSNVQSDWNQNDETQPDYVKNRPFYKAIETVNTTVDINWDGRTTGLVTSSKGNYCKISDDIFTKEQFLQMYFLRDGSEITVTEDMLNFNNYVVTYGADSSPVIVIEVGGGIPGGVPDTFTETGIYFPSNGCVTKLASLQPIESTTTTIKKIEAEFLPDSFSNIMSSVNPTGTGSFSMNRNSESEIGKCSHAEGYDATASGSYSHAEGISVIASGNQSHAEGNITIASGQNSHAEGSNTIASGSNSHAEGWGTIASEQNSHAEGWGTKASSPYQHVQGKWNINDFSHVYAHIVGNGTTDDARSNAHTLDWSGNAWYAGTVEGKALILPSSTENSTKKFRITVDDSGALTATEVT